MRKFWHYFVRKIEIKIFTSNSWVDCVIVSLRQLANVLHILGNSTVCCCPVIIWFFMKTIKSPNLQFTVIPIDAAQQINIFVSLVALYTSLLVFFIVVFITASFVLQRIAATSSIIQISDSNLDIIFVTAPFSIHFGYKSATIEPLIMKTLFIITSRLSFLSYWLWWFEIQVFMNDV